MSLAPCPCGQTPTALYLDGERWSSHATACGDCCSEWIIEFHTNSKPLDSPECMELAIKAWNAAPRGK